MEKGLLEHKIGMVISVAFVGQHVHPSGMMSLLTDNKVFFEELDVLWHICQCAQLFEIGRLPLDVRLS